MLIEQLKTFIVESFSATTGGANGPVVFTSTGDKFVYTPPAPVRLLKWGVVFNVALSTGANGLVLNLAKRPTAGSDTGRTTVDTATVAINNTTFVAGLGFYRDPLTVSTTATTPASEVSSAGPLGSTPGTITSGQAQFTFIPGQEIVVAVGTAASTTGQGFIWLELELLPISKPSAYGTTDAGVVSLTENYTRLAS